MSDIVRQKIDLVLTDTHLGFWGDNPNDPAFRRDVYEGCKALLWRRGWTLAKDPSVHYRSLARDYRVASKGPLRASLQICGRHVKLEFWAETAVQTNSNGRRYDFDKRGRMPFLDSIRFQLESGKVIDWVCAAFDVTISDKTRAQRPTFGELTAMDFIENSRKDEALWSGRDAGRHVPDPYNSRNAAGEHIQTGQTVWFRDRKGRALRGVAYYGINNMWHVVTSRWSTEWKAAFELLTSPPADLRARANDRARRVKLEAELAKAIQRMDFRRAETLRRICFGEDELFLIWSRKNNAYYASCYSGYSADRLHAGKYSRAEAAAEVARVAHILDAHTLDGIRVDMAAPAEVAA